MTIGNTLACCGTQKVNTADKPGQKGMKEYILEGVTVLQAGCDIGLNSDLN